MSNFYLHLVQEEVTEITHHPGAVLIHWLNGVQFSSYTFYSKLQVIETRALDLFVTTMAAPTYNHWPKYTHTHSHTSRLCLVQNQHTALTVALRVCVAIATGESCTRWRQNPLARFSGHGHIWGTPCWISETRPPTHFTEIMGRPCQCRNGVSF